MNGFPVRFVVAFPARSVVAFPTQSGVAFPARSVVAFTARSVVAFPARSVVAFLARSVVAFPARSVVAFPAQFVVAFPTQSDARVVWAPVRIPDYGPQVQDGSRAVKKYFHPVSTSIALLKAPDATRGGPQHEASTLRCPLRGPIRRNSSCLAAGDSISHSQRNSVLRAVAAPGTR